MIRWCGWMSQVGMVLESVQSATALRVLIVCLQLSVLRFFCFKVNFCQGKIPITD